ncbi:MAG TPA: hypothetical protein P5555_13595 [Candidatus Paceibacterota bacterium]|nr:hypothetical protein [Verrucomicrobiota bacterium]HRZ46218.1 hypothetical protein [Candidatus Paceibacterota bacterium]HRZ92235.1 hypothetical protein [Candidatus Paceibacterota bacterium]
MKSTPNRRHFLKTSAAAALTAPWVMSFEERALMAQESRPSSAPALEGGPKETVPQGRIGKVQIGRLICGGNLVSGYAHSRDLIYVSRWLRQYFTDDKIWETWSVCEQHGINTMIVFTGDQRAVSLYEKYRAQGGRIQFLAQISPDEKDMRKSVAQARDAGAVGAFLVGNTGDSWTRTNKTHLIGDLLPMIRDHGMIAGVAGHEVRTIRAVEEAGFNPDFYMKTLHGTDYWSARRPDQTKEVIDNYGADNYWCSDPADTIAYMAQVKRPWIAYKVLAAGAIHPRAGFRHAFQHGADFAAVGMFDFQVAENVATTGTVLRTLKNRERSWLA